MRLVTPLHPLISGRNKPIDQAGFILTGLGRSFPVYRVAFYCNFFIKYLGIDYCSKCYILERNLGGIVLGKIRPYIDGDRPLRRDQLTGNFLNP
jgi:hypothetical protein